MFTKEELKLIDAALTEYWLKHNEDYERQKAKGRRDCDWHLSVLKRCTDLQGRIFNLLNGGECK